MTEALLRVEGLDAWYGRAHVLQDVSFEVGSGVLGVVGRNGMGKTTLCKALMGLVSAEGGGSVAGSATFSGAELVGLPVERVAATGVGYVPQGRRVFASLSVDEHLRMVRPRFDGPWSPDAVYELFPRLAQRRRVGAGMLSGGEQQMLAVGRALRTQPRLLIMDEPSEGLAPAIVEHLVATCRKLAAEGMPMLVVEQKLAVAAALADELLIMVTGRIARTMSAADLVADEEAQSRYLGVAAA